MSPGGNQILRRSIQTEILTHLRASSWAMPGVSFALRMSGWILWPTSILRPYHTIYTNPAQIYTIYTLSASIRFTVGRGVLLPLSLICRYKLTKLKNPVLSSESPLASDFAVETQEDNLLFAASDEHVYEVRRREEE